MTLGFIVLLSLTFGFGGSLLISASFNDALSRTTDVALGSHRLLLYTLAAVSGNAPANDDEAVGALEQLDAQGSQNWTALRLSDGQRTIYQSKNMSSLKSDILEDVDSTHLASRIELTKSGAHLLLIAGRFETKTGPRFLESAYDISSIYDARLSQEDIYRKAFAVVIVLGAVVSWLLTFWLTRPLQRLSDVSQKIASGDLTCRAEGGKDEIGKLALDFNYMTERLEENITELRDTMHRQEAFMGYFAHELKTPMTSIIGYADLLRSHELSENDRREAANYVFTEGRRLEVLSLKLLDLIVLKKRDMTLVPVSVRHLVAEIVRLLKPIAVKSGVTVRYQCDDGLCLLEPDLVKSLLINLTDNARKALDNGGRIMIESKTLPDGCIIRVADNGRGIPETELAKITDAFYRVDKSRSRAQGGVGLGLSLCSEIVALHNGEMSFESVVGKGTIVTVELKGGAV